MCLAVPLRVVEIKGNTAVGEIDGIKRNIRVDFIKDLSVGDFVIAHAGFAIEKLGEEQARLNLEAIREVSNVLR
ncbi:MAG: HypC/HybG/HupF family hydrogenase formation chaperone [Oscillospiraceae bacterium]